MSTGIIAFFTVFVLAAFVGNEVISKVPSVLHTPLMSGSNAIHGIILVGTMIVMGEARGAAQITLAFFAVLLATLNVVGGFVVTDRMLEMFKGKPSDRPGPAAGAGAPEVAPPDAPTSPDALPSPGGSAPGAPGSSASPGTSDPPASPDAPGAPDAGGGPDAGSNPTTGGGQ
ncbi:MAG: proton-translocating transhydrogenase family protein [Acidimicrobiales bacterium]